MMPQALPATAEAIFEYKTKISNGRTNVKMPNPWSRRKGQGL
jgi:hypothetical protein